MAGKTFREFKRMELQEKLAAAMEKLRQETVAACETDIRSWSDKALEEWVRYSGAYGPNHTSLIAAIENLTSVDLELQINQYVYGKPSGDAIYNNYEAGKNFASISNAYLALNSCAIKHPSTGGAAVLYAMPRTNGVRYVLEDKATRKRDAIDLGDDKTWLEVVAIHDDATKIQMVQKLSSVGFDGA